MALIPAKCTQCGANITVDDSKEAGICEFCGTAFITEKAINNYAITNNISIANATLNVVGADVSNLLLRAQQYESVGETEKALEYYNRILDIDANHEIAKGKVFPVSTVSIDEIIIDEPKPSPMDSFKKAWIDFLFCSFLGMFGVHKFREKNKKMGYLYLFTLGLCGIGWMIDFFWYYFLALKATFLFLVSILADTIEILSKRNRNRL